VRNKIGIGSVLGTNPLFGSVLHTNFPFN